MSELTEQSIFQCIQCNLTFHSQRHMDKHWQGHKVNNCELCDALLSTRKQHVIHMFKTHNIVVKLEKYNCEHCEKHFLKKLQLYSHYKKEHAGELVVCFKCGMFLNPNDEKSHQEKHEEESHWKCKTCKPVKYFSRKQQYLHHIKAHEKYKCTDCKLSFPTKRILYRHSRNVHQCSLEDKLYTCHICGMRFPRPGLLQQHNRTHSGEKPFSCKDCNKQFISLKGYKKHLYFTHQGYKTDTLDVGSKNNSKYICDKCEKSFSKKTDLIKHLGRPHSYPCKFCSFESTSKENAKRHESSHTESRQFVCEQCGTAFFTLSNLQDHHLYMHSSERSFQCPQCTSNFKTNSALNRHFRTHSDLRPYGCHCGQTYKRISHLNRHQHTTHGPVKSKRLQRLKLDESGILVPVVEAKPSKTRNKPKTERRQEVESASESPIETPILSLFVADSGHVFTLQQACTSDLPETSAHQNEMDSYQTDFLQTMQVAYDQHMSPAVNTDSQLVFNSVEMVQEQYLHEPVESTLPVLDDSFFASHEPRTVAHYQPNEISLTTDQSFFDAHHGVGTFGLQL